MSIPGPVRFSTATELAYERIPSDAWLGWCMDCGPLEFQFNHPVIPEIFIGRLPVNSLAEVTSTIAKIVNYENFSADQLWRRKILLVADDQFSGVSTFPDVPGTSGYCWRSYEDRFLQLSETIRNVITIDGGLVESDPEVFSMAYWLRNEPIDPVALPDSCRPDRGATQIRTRNNVTPEMFNRLNDGRLWWNYQGHSNEQELSHEDIYRNLGGDDDKSRFTNDGKLFFFSSFSCHPNSFGRWYEAGSFGPSLGEEMVTLPNRGAVASWGSTGYEVIPQFGGVKHVNVELARAVFVDPPRDPSATGTGARPVIGEAIALALARWVPQASSLELEVGASYELLGDPATRIWAGPPQAAVTANDVPAADGVPIRLHTPGPALTLKATLVSNASLAAIALVREDSSSVDTIPPNRYTITPTFPDTGAASHGGRVYQARLDTLLTPESFRYVFRTADRFGITRAFEATFAFSTLLRADGQTVNDGDVVAPAANLTLFVQSPAPVVPTTDLTLTLNGNPVTFVATPDPGDASGREWLLQWTHDPLPIDRYVLELRVTGGTTAVHAFRVDVGGGELRIDNAFAFPNPFRDDAYGTNFSFTLISGAPADVLIRVYTVTGKLVYERKERGLAPGYHQLAWDGLDLEGQPLANGTYFYRLLASNGTARAMRESRLVKIRKPRRGTLESAP
jgi:Peptidase family C25/FlgD Ig-like domain